MTPAEWRIYVLVTYAMPSLVQIMASCPFGIKPLSKPLSGILLIGPLGVNVNEILIAIRKFSFNKIPFKCHVENGSHFVWASIC